MEIKTTRFGIIDCPPEQLLHFSAGLIGFYDEHDFVLVHHARSEVIGWLQSVKTPHLAFPVVSVHAFSGYPDAPIKENAARTGLAERLDNYAVMAVLSAQVGQPATVNLLAPLVVDTDSRRGAQVILENTRFSARELFVLQHKGADLQTEANPAPRGDTEGAGRRVG